MSEIRIFPTMKKTSIEHFNKIDYCAVRRYKHDSISPEALYFISEKRMKMWLEDRWGAKHLDSDEPGMI